MNIIASTRSDKIAKTFSYYAAFIMLGMAQAALGPTLPGLARHTQTDIGQMGFLFTVRSLGYMVGAWVEGRLYDHWPGHRLMAALLVVMMVMMFVIPLLPLFWLLVVAFLLLGAADGGVDVGGNTLLMWVHGHKVGPFMNGLHFFFGVGAFLAPIIIAQMVLLSGDITAGYWVLGLVMIPVALWLIRLPSPPIGAATEEGAENEAVRRNPTVVFLTAFFLMLYVGTEVSYGGWIFTYAIQLELTGPTVAAYLTSAFWGSFTAGRLLAIPLATRLRPRFIMLTNLGGCLLSLGLMLLWPRSLPVIWIGTVGLGLSMASIFPTMLSMAERRMTITGQVTAWFFVGASVGGMTLPWLIGQLLESVGPHILMIVSLSVLLAALGILGILMGKSPDEDYIS